MPVVKHFTQAQWDAAARRLDALPDKPAHEHRVTVRDAVRSMQSQIRGAQQKGYTLDEIVQQLAQEGIAISASTLRYAMQRVTNDRKVEPAGKPVPTAQATASPRAKKPKQTAGLSNVDHVGNRDRQGKGRATTKPGTMVIQDAFSFEITPDTENL
ncbi:hypothetical protein E2P84_05410 [Burkholderia cepacia]|uniref:DNA-binding protein n=1 Tax=Burkholderia cepacia TaxID=292 RepID=A0AAX2RZ77_BURCE|nr:hypothetical protein [Burkholderia cepacia]TES81906.1 hypothetical protein E2P84_05410 [Burkholderia cepacia]TEU40238.1 hypothetical protein E3D39_19510 [Burkholderia cepacia]TEU53986.1 hypothetical protein E3D37_02600 [Burkholderia cepacia]TEU57911.1 hypothetical protein E3D38_02390 [Burkholderia cepacia]TEU78291.1 hypothetical protein E3D42_06345 [Burkholderia cepacia]